MEFIRSYFLSFDEEEQENIFSSLSDEQKDLIVEAGVVFLSNGGVETISENSYLIEHKRELKDIQLEYFIGLADILAAGGTNEVIEKLKRSKNLLFEEVLAEFKDNTLFENDLLAGIRSVERTELKQDLSLLDKEEELGIPEDEIKYAISQIERKTLKRKLQEIEDSFAENDVQHATVFSGEMEPSVYSRSSVSKSRIRFLPYAVAAAVLIIFIFTIGLRYQFNEKPNIKSKNYSAVGPAKRIHDANSKTKTILVPLVREGATDTIKFEIISLLSISNENIESADNSFYGGIGRRSRIFDSLQALVCKYYFDLKSKSVLIYLKDIPNDINVRLIQSNGRSKMFIMLNSKFYKVEPNENFTELVPVANGYLVDSLNDINIYYK